MKLHTEWVLLSNSGIPFVVSPPNTLWLCLDERLPIVSETFAHDVKTLIESRDSIIALLCVAELKEFLTGPHRFSDRSGETYKASSVVRLALSEPETHEVASALALACEQDVLQKPDSKSILELLYAYPDSYATYLERQTLAALETKYPASHPGFVYLMRLPSGEYKIGYSVNVQQRNRQLSGGMPHKLAIVHVIPTNQMACLEYELHKRFHGQRVPNTEEWFHLSDEDVSSICKIVERKYPWVESDDQYPDAPKGKVPDGLPSFGQFKPLENQDHFRFSRGVSAASN